MAGTKNKSAKVLGAEEPISEQNVRISDSLIAVANDLAPVLAEIDPFPHSNLLGKSRAHLHLMAVTYVRTQSLGHTQQVFDQEKFGNACECAFGERINGLEGILKRCPANLFPAETYKRLHDLISSSNAMKVLRHAEAVTADLIETIHNLPEEMHHAGVVNKLRDPDEALIVQLACSDEKSNEGNAQRARLSERLSHIRSAEKFWEAVMDELVSQLGPIPTPPIIDHPNFYPVKSLQQVIKTAKKFRNCVRNYLSEVKRGELAFYIFARDEESAVIGIKPAFGCSGMIMEVKGPENTRLRQPLYDEVIDILKRNGFKLWLFERRRDLDDIPRCLDQLTDCESPHEIKKMSNLVIQSFLENL